MAGIKALRKIQLGRETTAGNAVVATTIYRGKGTLEDQQEIAFAEEDIGYLSGVDRTYSPKDGAALSMESVEATFEQLPHILEAGIKTATPAQDGAGSGYIYSYEFPTTAANTIKTYTIEGGDNQAVEEIEYAYVSSFTLVGEAGAAWMMTAEWIGRQVLTSAFTGSLSLPAVEEILFQKTKLYIDNVSGAFGGTLKSNTLLGATLNVTTGLIPKFTADGELYFSFVQTTSPEVTLDITFEHDGTAVAEKANRKAETPRLIRLLAEGSTFTTAGTTYSKKTMIIDLAGKWETFEKIGEQDGNDIVSGVFRSRRNATIDDFGSITMVIDLASIP